MLGYVHMIDSGTHVHTLTPKPYLMMPALPGEQLPSGPRLQ